jgi:hypothetical protein
MSAVAVHIGVPKTASSFIQTWLRQNHRRLADHGIWAPNKPIHAHRLAVEHLSGKLWDNRPDVIEIRKTHLDEARRGFLKAASSRSTAVTIVSSEYFYYADPAVVAPALREQLGPDLDIVVYIRSQCDLVLSGHNQDIKRLGKTASRPKPSYSKLYDWGLLLDSWAKEFGKEHIKAISFDLSSRGGTILADFVAAACPIISREFADGVFEQSPALNESLPADLLEFKRIANMIGPTDIYDYQWLEDILRTGYVGPRFGVSADEVRAWQSFYAERNEYVAREYFGGVSAEEIFPDPQRGIGVDLEEQLPVETVAKLLAFAVKRQEGHRTELEQRIRALEAQIASMRKSEARKP